MPNPSELERVFTESQGKLLACVFASKVYKYTCKLLNTLQANKQEKT